MRILFLISQLPYPPDTGAKIRSFNLIKRLSASHSIIVVSYGDGSDEFEKVRKLKELSVRVEFVPKMPIDVRMLVLKNLFSPYPYSTAKYYSKKMRRKIMDLLKREEFHLIHCDSLQMSRNLPGAGMVPRILTEHNIESMILKRAAENADNILKKTYLYLQYIKMRRYEISTCRRFDRIIAVSEEDKGFFAKFIPEERISVIPNGVDTNYFRPATSDERRVTSDASIVFTGSMDWIPNIDAVEYFCRTILPIIWRANPCVKFYIVGRNQPGNISSLGERDDRIIVTGTVDDVRPYIEKAKVVVVPLRIGGGTRLKILESFSMRKAVVSTPIGCEGLTVSDGRDIVIADDPSEFAMGVLRLLRDDELRRRLGEAGRRLVEGLYDWNGISAKLNYVWKTAVNHKGVPILLYHDICDNTHDIRMAPAETRPYILDEYEFEKQMKWLCGNGYKTIGIKELVCGLRFAVCGKTKQYANAKTICLVFDDGLKSNYTKALPILKRYGLKATFFITAGMVGREGMMSWKQIKELIGSGMAIGSHSLTHAIPVNLADRELEWELLASKEMLEKNLGVRVDYFSSPTGFHNSHLPDIARRTGYKAVLVSKSALNMPNGDSVLNKMAIKRNYSFGTFVSIVEHDKLTFKSLSRNQNMRDLFKTVLGPNMYNSLRRVMLERAL